MTENLQFTAHNMLFPDGSYSIGPNVPLLETQGEVTKVIGFLKDFLKISEGAKLVDLGCLEGGHSLEFARAGFDTTGVEIRQQNIDCCNYVLAKSGLENKKLKFVKDDVRNLAKIGKFDVTFCAGLLYHLSEPVDFLKTVAENTNRAFVLHTHFSRLSDPIYGFPLLKFGFKVRQRLLKTKERRDFGLSRLTSNENVRGRWYPEFEEDTSLSVQETLRWTSWKNHKSFWIAKEDLVQVLKEFGFRHVFELYDHVHKDGGLGQSNALEYNDWGLFVAIK